MKYSLTDIDTLRAYVTLDGTGIVEHPTNWKTGDEAGIRGAILASIEDAVRTLMTAGVEMSEVEERLVELKKE